MANTFRGLIGLVLILAGLHEPERVESGCDDHIACTALAVLAEANGEPFVGQVQVARVILARGPNPCETIVAKGQFAGIEDWPPPRDPHRWGERAWRIALAAAWIAKESTWESPCEGDTHFYAHDAVTPAWAAEACVIDNHTFTTPRKP